MPVSRGASGLALCLLTFVLACGSTDPDPTPKPGADNDKVASLTLTPNGATLLVGESLTLAAQAFDDSGHVLREVKVTWSLALPGAATVSDGRLTGVAVGASIVTARVGSVSKDLTVLVMPSDASSPSSDALLTSAREAGLINDEELLAYRVYAAMGDPRLPPQYKARVELGFDVTPLEELHARFDTLSEPMQRTLGMYLLRPADPGSWLNTPVPDTRLSSMARPSCRPHSEGWDYQARSNSKVRVWYEYGVPDLREKAVALADAVDQDIWPKLMGLGLKEPLPDEGITCNGGSSQIDIYLSRNMGGRGLTLPEGLTNTQAATYILLAADLDKETLKRAVTHELMHAIQWSYKTKAPQNSYGWIRDSTANWAIDQVYGKDSMQLEQQYADCFTSTPELSLEDRTKGHCTQASVGNAERDYGAYVFFQFLAKKYGPNVVVAAVERMTTETSSLSAVDAAVPGKLEKVWPEFAKVLWNQAPIDTKAESFKAWDGLTEKVKFQAINANLGGAAEDKQELPDELKNLANRYEHFTFSDTNTRSVLFHNGWFKNITEAKEPVKVQAFWNDASGAWHEEDWSDYEYVGLCRDLKAQRVQDLIVITSNAKFQPGGGGSLKAQEKPYLKRSTVGCWKYKGTTKAVLKGVGWSGQGKILDSNMEYQVLGAFVGADYKHPSFPNTQRVGAFMIMPPSGDFTLDIDYVFGGCRYRHGPTQYSLVASGGVMLMNPFNELKSPDSHVQEWLSHPSRAYTSALGDGRIVNVAVSGGPDCRGPVPDAPGNILFTDDGGTKPLVKPNGELSGQFIYADTTFTWNLQPQIEP
jgi:hypothetical protein